MYILSRATIASLAIAAISIAQAQTAPDNTRQNSVDSTNKTASADMQKNDKADLALTQQIRASVVADKSLSTYAHNVKIVAVNGNVTLNGVVHSRQEKDSIEAKAQAVVKNGSVVDNLTITP
jgi:hyperosmotically inducible protein